MSISNSLSLITTDQKRSVRFQLIELIEIAIVLGDNPSLSTGGPPMSLGWDHIRRSEFDLDYYETYRPKRKENRRDLIISGKKRTKFFLRCGYSLPEIEEAAAMSLNYRNQMTITKLLDPPTVIKDAVKDRFASYHESGSQTQRHRISRRHSMEPLEIPRRLPESGTSTCTDEATSSGRGTMSRRLSNFELGNGLVRRLSTERLTAPVRAISPIKQTHATRRNSPTASPTASPARPIEVIRNKQQGQMHEGHLQLPTRSISPDSPSRNVRRYHSAPLAANQGLRKPVRTLSPCSLSPDKDETMVTGRLKSLKLLDATLSGEKNNAPSLPIRVRSPSPPLSS